MNNASAPTDDMASPEAPSKLTEWNNEPTLSSLKQNYEDAQVEVDKHIIKVDDWLNNLNITGSAKLDKVKNRSSIQPKLIRKQAEWRYSSLSEPFLSTPDIFNVSPVTFEDKEAAKQNELVLNYQFNHHINKVNFIDEYVRTAVDEGTVIVRVGWEYEEKQETVLKPVYGTRPNNSPEFVAMIQQAFALSQSDPEQFKQLPPELTQSLMASQENGQPVEVYVEAEEEVLETKIVRNQPTAEVCNIRDVVVDPTCRGDISKAKFVVHKFVTSLEELKSLGHYKNLDQIKLTGNSILADPDHESEDNSSFNFTDTPRKKFIAYEYWGYWDINDEGTVEPFVATWVGNTLIRLESNPFPSKELPFVTVPYLPVRKSLYGEPDGELIKDNQDIVGAVTRGMIDILASSANGQRGYAMNALDVTNRRRFEQGKDYQFNPGVDPRLAFHTEVFPEIPASSQFVLQATNADAESLTGVKAFNSGISGQALGDTATGVRGALDASSKRELGILRRLAHGMVEIGRKIISMNSEFLGDEEIIRVTNEEFVAINREALAGSFDLRLTISTAEEDNQKAQELAFMLQTTAPSSDPAEVRMIRSEIARLRKMPELAKRIAEYQPEPDPLEQRRRELELELIEAQIADYLNKGQENGAQAQLHIAKAKEAESQADLNNLQFVEQESGVQQERDLQKQGEQAKANAKLETFKHVLAEANKPNK